MPRIEFKTDIQREIFNDWLAKQIREGRVDLIGENSRGYFNHPKKGTARTPTRMLEVLEIGDEPVHIEVEKRGNERRRVAIKIGEGKIAAELRKAGVIFDAEEDVFGVQRDSFRRSTPRFI